MDNQQGPAIQLMELCSISCGSLDGRFWGRMNMCMYMAESLCSPPETITTLLNSCESESRSVMSDSLWPHGLYSPWDFPGQNTGVGSLSLLQWIFLTQGLNWGLLHCRWILYQLSYQGSLNQLYTPIQNKKFNFKNVLLNLPSNH